ncbi:MAG: hypothetical protein IJV07_02960 [Alphaproteobacteria bacterium]|nr:hypothetical protein [Alphaproteobacteria bacterium]
MKKSLFVLTATLMASSAAFAMDVSNPFYVPMKGDFLSETNIAYNNFEHGKSEDTTLAETLSYGITRNFSVNGTIADTWLFDAKGVTGHDRYDNPAWGIGLKYNLVDCCKTNWKVQLGANYDQGGVDHHDKTLSAYAKAGYQMGRFLPYVTATMEKPVGKYEEAPTWEGRAALNTAFSKKVNLDAGIIYDWSASTNAIRKTTGERKHASGLGLDSTLNYVFSDCMSVGLTGQYLLDTKPNNVDAYSVGVNFKVAF